MQFLTTQGVNASTPMLFKGQPYVAKVCTSEKSFFEKSVLKIILHDISIVTK